MTGRRIPDDTREQIADAYASGRTSTDVAHEYGVSVDLVTTCAKEYGVPIRGWGGKRPDELGYGGGWRQDGLIQRPRVNVRALGEEAS